MRLPFRPPPLAWWFVPVLALVVLAWGHSLRARQVLRLAEVGTPAVVVDRDSPTGYAGGWRKLVVPEPNHVSHQWIEITQQLQATGDWRVRWTGNDNAPTGRAVHAPSPYAWWLTLVAGFDQAVSGRPAGIAAERTLVTADPWLHVVWVTAATIVVAWQFGYGAAAVVLVGVAFLYPLAGAFAPGRPNELTLALVAVFLSVFGLVAAVAGRSGASGRGFAAAGAAAAFGLWLSPGVQVPLILGTGVGAMLAAWVGRQALASGSESALPWRAWGMGGAVGVLVAYGLEYWPAGGGLWELRTVHPIYGLAWLGWAEILRRVEAWGQRAPIEPAAGGRWRLALAFVALALVPAVMWKSENAGFTLPIAFAERMTELKDGVAGANLLDALTRAQSIDAVLVALLPVLGLGMVAWALVRGVESRQRRAAGLALGPLVVALGYALVQLRWWAVFDAVVLATIPVAWIGSRRAPSAKRWLAWAVGTTLVVVPGLWLSWPRDNAAEGVNVREVRALIERDLAYWLANRTGPEGAIVLAPPQVTSSLVYHGGHRGLGSLNWENRDGFAAAVRLSSTTSPDEAQALFAGRGVTHVVLPSWDPFLDQYARLGTQEADKTLVSLLQRWLPPRWLRPIPYDLPMIEGFPGASVSVFEVVEVQEQSLALSRLAEYFVETSRPDAAVAVAAALQQAFGGELDAQVAQAQVHAARLDGPAFGRVLQTLLPMVEAGAGDALPLDRRVALASVLAQGRQPALARTQVQHVLRQLDERALRSLTLGELFRLLRLCEDLAVAFPQRELAELARQLLPAELRQQLSAR